MKFKFQVVKNDTVLVYDNVTNTIETEDGIPFGNDLLPPLDEYENRFGQVTKSKKPTTIKIILGHGCNYSCGYCMQKDIGNPDERTKNTLTPMLIKSIRRHVDVSELERFELWGGETLLYWQDIVPLMTEFDREGLEWYIPTNGTLLRDKHVDFFKTLKGTVAIGISHDGPGHESTRGPEFLHRKVDVLRRIQTEAYPRIQFSFNAVISRTNFDLFAINDYFKSYMEQHGLQPVSVIFELGRTYDPSGTQNSTHHVITGDDVPVYECVLTKYLRDHIAQFKDPSAPKKLLTTNLFHSGMGVIPYAKTLRQQSFQLLKSSCGVDDSRLMTMDMMGNVRTCQNVDTSYVGGNIMNIKGIRVQKVNLERDGCTSCGNYRICRSSCPLDLGDEVFATNCKLEKVHYRAIRTAALALLFDSEIKWL